MAARKNVIPFYSAPSLQRGYGMAIYRGNALQRGHGLGGLFKGLFRTAAPIIRRTGKKILKSVGQRALKAGANVLSDIAEYRASPKEALKSRVKEIFVPPNTINKSAPEKTVISKSKPKGKVRRRPVKAPFMK